MAKSFISSVNLIACPRFQRCSAAICPLQGSVLEQRMLNGERVCGVLLEYQKVGSRTFLTTHYGAELVNVMAEATEQINARGTYLLRSAINRAARTGTKLALVGCS